MANYPRIITAMGALDREGMIKKSNGAEVLSDVDIDMSVELNYEETKESKMNVNMLAAALLIRDDVTTVSVNVGKGTSRGVYTFICDKELAKTLKPEAHDQFNCMVLVETRNGFTPGKVVSIHTDMEIDIDTDVEYKYVVCKIDLEALNAKKAQDRKVAKHLLRHRQKSTRMSVLSALGITDSSKFLEQIKDEPDDEVDPFDDADLSKTRRGSDEMPKEDW